MFDIISLGELLIDFTPCGKSEQGSFMFEANSGGAPCNVLAAAVKLGKSAAFIGKVGKDAFGDFLKETLVKLNIDTAGLIQTPDYFTTLAFVTLDDAGNRNFAFSRKNSADVMLTPEEVDERLIKASRIFHCGTLSLTDDNCRAATIKALDIAKENGVLISVDPNLRKPLWKNEQAAKDAMRLVMEYADVIKISDYEIEFLYNQTDIIDGAKRIMREYSPKALFVTCGKDGAYMLKNDMLLCHPCFSQVKTIDTTGAGDSFCGTVLSALLDLNLDFDALGERECLDILRFANAAASLATAKRGAIPAMPEMSEIRALLNQ